MVYNSCSKLELRSVNVWIVNVWGGPTPPREMTAERIKTLRERKGLTQSTLARMIGITRSSVNAWEMGISTPSTQYLVELAKIFNVSTDYLLGLEATSSINTDGLSEEDILAVHMLVEQLRKKNQ